MYYFPKLLLLVITSTDALKERLVFSKIYIREVLPIEAKETKFANKPKDEADPAAQPVDKVDSVAAGSTMSALEKFRQQKGKFLKILIDNTFVSVLVRKCFPKLLLFLL